MSPVQSHEPSADTLSSGHAAYEIHLLSFDRDLVKLEVTDFLPRYNRLRFTIKCRAPYAERPLFLTVRRLGSKLGEENFYTVPFFAGNIPVGSEAEYELLCFDSFVVPVESMSVEMCRTEDYIKRRISPKHIERAKKFSTEIHRKNG